MANPEFKNKRTYFLVGDVSNLILNEKEKSKRDKETTVIFQKRKQSSKHFKISDPDCSQI